MSASEELPWFAVDRPRLRARLDAGLEGRLTLVLGPSGAGKSVLLRQWAASLEDRCPISWLTIDGALGDAVSFAKAFVASIAASQPGFGSASLSSLETGGHQMGASFLESLAAELDDLGPHVVVVEDLHALPSSLVAELEWLMRRLPPQVHLVISSRFDPPMSLSRMRAAGTLTEVLPADLCMDPTEARVVIRSLSGVEAAPDQIDRLLSRTEGWAVGVQLMATRLSGGADFDRELSSFHGAGREVADYLVEEVVSQQSPEVQRFLRQTAVLDRLDAELCNAVMGGRDGEKLLDDVVRRNLFIVPVASSPGSFRYHQLFAELLRHQLRVEDLERHDELLMRAADWLEDRGELAESVECLLRARRWERALDLIGLHGFALIESDDAARAIRWLESVPVSERRRHGQAELTLITLHRMVGNAAITNILLDDIDRRHAPGSYEVMFAQGIRVAGIRFDIAPEVALREAERALAWLADPPANDIRRPSEPPYSWNEVGLKVGMARSNHLLGRYDEARAWARQVIEYTLGYHQWTIRALGLLARIELVDGDLGLARGTAERAIALRGEHPSHDVTSITDAHLALGMVAYERDELTMAEHWLTRAETEARTIRASPLLVSAVAGQAHVALARGRLEEGLDLLARWRNEGLPMAAAMLRNELVIAEVRLLLALDDVRRAKRAMGQAEPAPELLPIVAQLAAAEQSDSALGVVLDRWPASRSQLSRMQYSLWSAFAEARAGNRSEARSRLATAAELAQVHGHRRVFVDAGPEVLEFIRDEAMAVEGDRFDEPLGALLAVVNLTTQRAAPVDGRAVLTDREIAVLHQLETRLSNVEIAEELAISPNTLKTHLKRIYRKLEVSTRRGAVEQAQEIGILRGGR